MPTWNGNSEFKFQVVYLADGGEDVGRRNSLTIVRPVRVGIRRYYGPIETEPCVRAFRPGSHHRRRTGDTS